MEIEYKYEIGDSVIFINSYGVNLGHKTIVGKDIRTDTPVYYIQPTDAPWFPVEEQYLHYRFELLNKEAKE